MEIVEVTEEEQVDKFLSDAAPCLKILFFHIPDLPECDQMSDILTELANNKEHKGVKVGKINAKRQELVVKKYNVANVPTVIFYREKEVERLVGANVPVFVKTLSTLVEKFQGEGDLNSRLEKLINKAPCMLFMKGSPDVPRCGFSKQVIELLQKHSAKFETFDILEDFEVREGLKKYSNWPTYPQFYVKGDLIGGLDILKELSSSGELDEVLKQAESS